MIRMMGTTGGKGTRIRSVFAIAGLALAMFTGCQQPDLSHRLNMPSEINPVKDPADWRIPGSVLFMKPVSDVTADGIPGVVLYKNRNAISTIVLPKGNLTDSIFVKRCNIESFWTTNRERFYWNSTFQFSGCPANIYYYRPLQGPNDSIAIFWDNDIFSALETTGFERGDLATRDSLLQIMLSAYIKTAVTDTITSAQPFNVNLEGTTFVPAGRIGEGYFYNVGGEALNLGRDYFMVMEPEFIRALDLKTRIKELTSLYGRDSIKIGPFTTSVVSGLGGQGYKLEGKCAYRGKEGQVMILMIGSETHPLLLSAFLFEDVEQRMSEIRHIANSLTYKYNLGR